MKGKNKRDKELQKNTRKTTEYEWDGIQEYDTPDPFWLRMVFYLALFFSIGYWFLYPSWPTSSTGILGWSSEKQLIQEQEKIINLRKKYQEKFDKASFEEIMKDEKLRAFGLAGGASAFADNCAICHGTGGRGNPGYPNLTAGAWLWGGNLDEIYTTIKYGIRSGHEQARDSVMAAFGRDKILSSEQIWKVVKYVRGLSQGKEKDPEADVLFQTHCASCHGVEGKGNREIGAPNLADHIWLYGESDDIIYDVIYNGRAGLMPHWLNRLKDSTIRQLTIYVHQLGGGE